PLLNAKTNGNKVILTRKGKSFEHCYLPHAFVRFKAKTRRQRSKAKEGRPAKRARTDAGAQHEEEEAHRGAQEERLARVIPLPPYGISNQTLDALANDLVPKNNKGDELTLHKWTVRLAACAAHGIKN